MKSNPRNSLRSRAVLMTSRAILPCLFLLCAMSEATSAQQPPVTFAATLARLNALAVVLSGRQDCYGHEVNLALEQQIKSEFPKISFTAAELMRQLDDIERTYRGVSCKEIRIRENARVKNYFPHPVIIIELEN